MRFKIIFCGSFGVHFDFQSYPPGTGERFQNSVMVTLNSIFFFTKVLVEYTCGSLFRVSRKEKKSIAICLWLLSRSLDCSVIIVCAELELKHNRTVTSSQRLSESPNKERPAICVRAPISKSVDQKHEDCCVCQRAPTHKAPRRPLSANPAVIWLTINH